LINQTTALDVYSALNSRHIAEWSVENMNPGMSRNGCCQMFVYRQKIYYSQLTTIIHWSCYCTVNVVIYICDSV